MKGSKAKRILAEIEVLRKNLPKLPPHPRYTSKYQIQETKNMTLRIYRAWLSAYYGVRWEKALDQILEDHGFDMDRLAEKVSKRYIKNYEDKHPTKGKTIKIK